MNHTLAREFYNQTLGIWPSARTSHTPATATVWFEHLQQMDPEIAQEALKILTKTKTMPPSIAELHEAYRAATPTPITKVIEPPIDVSGRAQILAMIGTLNERKPQPITADMLDKAGVVRWRERLDSAMHDDVDRQMGRANYDLAWVKVRTEYFAALSVGDPREV